MQELMRLKATNGTIIVYDDRVVIARKGFAAFATQGAKGDKTYFYGDIVSVDFKKPGLINGYIRFITAGANNVKIGASLSRTTQHTASDADTVVLRAFNPSVPKESEKLYNLVMEKIADAKSGKIGFSTLSSADEITKYKQLLDAGIITQKEFDAKKKQLLGL